MTNNPYDPPQAPVGDIHRLQSARRKAIRIQLQALVYAFDWSVVVAGIGFAVSSELMWVGIAAGSLVASFSLWCILKWM